MKIRVLKIVAIKEQKYITSIYANLDPFLSYQQVVGLSGNEFGSLKQASHLECLNSNPLKEISLIGNIFCNHMRIKKKSSLVLVLSILAALVLVNHF